MADRRPFRFRFQWCVCGMFEYRVYFIDRSGGIADAQWLLACDDDQAMSKAERLKTEFTLEVWQKEREVGTLDPSNHN